MSKRNKTSFFIVLFIVLSTGTARADGSLSESAAELKNQRRAASRDLSIVEVENQTPGFAVLVDVDRQDRLYTEDEMVTVKVKSSSDGYLYLLHQGPKGKNTLLIPNKFQKENFIKGGQTVFFPSEDSTFRFRVSGPSFGRETIKVFVTKKRLKSLGDAKFTISSVTPLDQETTRAVLGEFGARSRDITVEENPGDSDFATHEVVYTSRAKTQEPVSSNEEKRYAVCFGINKYKDQSIKNLKVCVKDAEAMRKLFVEKCGVGAKDCLVLTDEAVTLENLRRVFCEVLPELAPPNSTIFIYFSGHGGRIPALPNSTSTTGYTQFLIPHDADSNNPAKTTLLDDQFGIWAQKLNGRKLLFILDACQSGGMANRAKGISDGGLVDAFLRNAPESKSAESDTVEESFDFTFGFTGLARSKALGQSGLAVIASSAHDQVSFERQEGDLSVMTYAFIQTVLEGPGNMTHKDVKPRVGSLVNQYIRNNRHIQSAYPNYRQTVVEQDDLTPGLILKP